MPSSASHPETLRGQRYSTPCPTAKNWAPFVRGCAPEDAGANHDMRRVRLLDEQTVLATTGPANQPTGGSVLPSRRPQGLRRLSPADQRPGRITPAGDLTSSSPYPRHLTAMQLLSSSVRSDIEVMSPLDNPSRRSWGIAHRMATLQRTRSLAPLGPTHSLCSTAVIELTFLPQRERPVSELFRSQPASVPARHCLQHVNGRCSLHRTHAPAPKRTRKSDRRD